MLLLSWNVKFHDPCYRIEKIGSLIEKIDSVRPQIVTLQEVTRGSANCWADELKKIGLCNHYLSGKDVPTERQERLEHQCLIASRWEIKHDDIGWRSCAPYPESLGRATVSVPDEGDIDVFTAHIPNGYRNGWKKIDTLHVLSAELFRAVDSPRILTGDFNEPKLFQTSGQAVTFGVDFREGGELSKQLGDDGFGEKRPIIEWRNGVLSVLGGVSHHGLRDAYRDRHETPPPPTHYLINGNNPRYFDHTFVSRHFDVRECDYYHGWREQGLSDHSPMWTRLRLRTGLKQSADDGFKTLPQPCGK